ncbi:MAG: hypothetical protein H7144_09940, partial [Burkholderiales bacterium]|nr:hypothetical protein [Phycisphaerae bacterium]
IVVEQFQSLQTRIEDLINATLPGEQMRQGWTLPSDDAGAIVDTELDQLRSWLETRWNATPRDTAMLTRLLKVIPGTEKLGKYSEAAPYLLAIACVTHSAMLGHLDILVLGGYSAFTWLTERLSDEVASKTRATNQAISDRYADLATTQVERAAAWLDQLAPARSTLDQIARHVDDVRIKS